MLIVSIQLQYNSPALVKTALDLTFGCANQLVGTTSFAAAASGQVTSSSQEARNSTEWLMRKPGDSTATRLPLAALASSSAADYHFAIAPVQPATSFGMPARDDQVIMKMITYLLALPRVLILKLLLLLLKCSQFVWLCTSKLRRGSLLLVD